MKLLLTSNGLSSPELEKAFSELTNGRTDLKIAIIPTAGDPIDWIPEKGSDKNFIAKLTDSKERLEKNRKWVEGYEKSYTDKGYKVVMVDLKIDSAEIKEKLQNVDIIEVSGGDVNYLLNWAKKAKLDTYLKDLLDKGIVYYSASAGCGLVLPDIGLTWWEPGMKEDHISFGIVDFCMAVHQRENSEDRSTEHLIKRKNYFKSLGIDYPWKIYLVQDGQAIKVDGDKVEHIGPGVKRFI